MIASSNLSPPTRTEPLCTAPPSEITPTSVVPPPTSTTIEPVASATGRSAPIAAAIGSSIRNTWPAPAPIALSRIARRSTCVEPQGTQMMMRGRGREEFVVVHFLDEVLQHLLGDGEVGDHAVLHRADRDDVARRLAEHHLRFLADRLDRFLRRSARCLRGSRPPRAHRARCPCRARRSACSRCQDRSRDRWRSNCAEIRTCSWSILFRLPLGLALSSGAKAASRNRLFARRL